MAAVQVLQKVGREKLSAVDAETRERMDVKASGEGEWKNIQKKAFTNWFNVHLRQHRAKRGNGTTVVQQAAVIGPELGDGLLLIALLEQLSNQTFPRHNKMPRLKQQKLENLLQALKFLADSNVKLVNIGEW